MALLKELPARTYVAPTSVGCVSATWQRDRHVREREAKAAVRDRSVAIGSPTNQCRRPDVNTPKRVFSGDRIKQAAETIYQALIAAVIGGFKQVAGSSREQPH